MKTTYNLLLIILIMSSYSYKELLAQEISWSNVDCDTIMDYRYLNGSTNTQPSYDGEEAIKHFLSSFLTNYFCGCMVMSGLYKNKGISLPESLILFIAKC